jgi:hypothetical protein
LPIVEREKRKKKEKMHYIDPMGKCSLNQCFGGFLPRVGGRAAKTL